MIERDIVLQSRDRSGKGMESVTVSPKFQVVIPKSVREALRLKPGRKMQVVLIGGRIELIPVRKISEMRGFLRGMRTELDREEDRS
jgi:AbrB family looped-hinge helix DNA binding protein